MPDKPLKINPDDPAPDHPPFADLIINEQSYNLLSALFRAASVYGLYLRWEGRGYVHVEPTILGDMAYFSIRKGKTGGVSLFQIRCSSTLAAVLVRNALVEMAGYIYDIGPGIGLHATWINRKVGRLQPSPLSNRNEFERLCRLLSRPSPKQKGSPVDTEPKSGVK